MSLKLKALLLIAVFWALPKIPVFLVDMLTALKENSTTVAVILGCIMILAAVLLRQKGR